MYAIIAQKAISLRLRNLVWKLERPLRLTRFLQ